MFAEHPHLAFPNRSEKLWRYMNLEKFVSLAQTSALFFCRIDRLGDPYEGMVPFGTAEALGEGRASSWLAGGDGSAIERAKMARIYASMEPIQSGQARQAIEVSGFNGVVLANCWHRFNFESDAMWRLYAGSGNGVAIVTTGQSLTDALTCDEDVFIGDVGYFDYQKWSPEFPIHKAFGLQLAKRKAFEHEREVRALSMVPMEWSPPPSKERSPYPKWWLDDQPGHLLKVDLRSLIQSVVTAPTSAPWFLDLIRRLCRDIGLDTKVAQSTLLDPPEGYPSNMEVEAAAADYLETTIGLPIPKFASAGSFQTDDTTR